MRRIAERAEIGVMRGHDQQPAVRRRNAVEFFHGTDHIRDMLNHMDRSYGVERTIPERIRETVQVADDIGLSSGVAIDAYRAGILFDAAPDIENTFQGSMSAPGIPPVYSRQSPPDPVKLPVAGTAGWSSLPSRGSIGRARKRSELPDPAVPALAPWSPDL